MPALKLSLPKKMQLCKLFFSISLVSGTIIGVGSIWTHHLFTDQLYFLYIMEEFHPSLSNLYAHVVDMNTPTIYAYNIPAIFLSRITPLTIEQSFLIITTLFTCSLLWLSLKLLLSSKILTPQTSYLLMSSISFLTLTAGIDFGQRDHLAFTLILPYLMVNLNKLTHQKINLQTTLSVGILAGIGVSLKYHYLLVVVLSETLLLFKTRIVPIRQTQFIGFIATLLSIIAYYYFFLPSYLEILPIGFTTYAGFVTGNSMIFRAETIFLLVVVIYFTIKRNLIGTLGIYYITTFWLIGFLQNKGFLHHFFPFRTLTISFILLILSNYLLQIHRNKKYKAPYYLAIFSFITLTLSSSMYGLYRTHYPVLTISSPGFLSLVETVKIHSQNQSIAALNTALYPLHMLPYHAESKWVTRYRNFWMLPGFYTSQEKKQPGKFPYHHPNQMNQSETAFFNNVLTDLENNHPQLLLISISPYKAGFGPSTTFDYYEYFGQSPRFKEILKNYTQIKDILHNHHTYIYNPQKI